MINLIIIPTNVEIEVIESIIKTISNLKISTDIIVIYDSSAGHKTSLIKNLQTEFGNLYLIVRDLGMSLEAAYNKGYLWALKNRYDFVMEMDPDFSQNPPDLIRLFNACLLNGADMAIGSRYIKGITVVNWPLSRLLISYLASVFVRKITGMKIMDTTGRFICYKREVLENIRPDLMRSKGYTFNIEKKFSAYKSGYKLVEIPVLFTNRKTGSFKISVRTVNEVFWGVIILRLRSLFVNY